MSRERECFYCGDTGYIHTEDDIPDQMCSYCEIGQAVIKGFNVARDIGIQACDTLREAKDERIKVLEKRIKVIQRNRASVYNQKVRNYKRIKELEAKNEQLEKWQIKPTEAICLTGLTCRYQKVFKND